MAALDLGFDVAYDTGVGQRSGFVALAALLLAFLFIRTSARMIRANVSWWPGNVETKSGLHIHHLVWGILGMMIAGFLEFALAPGEPWVYVLAAAFGIGAGLTLDEFALWLRLEDVYWSAEGRESVDAVVIAVVFGALVLVGLSPFDIEGVDSWRAFAVVGPIDLLLVAITVLKGKLVTGLVGVFVLPVAVVGAIRLAKPDSAWGHRRYAHQPGRLARATARHRKRQALRTRVRDAIAGAPSPQ